MRPVRAALVGLGNSGAHYHLPLLTGRPDLQLVATCSTRPGAGPGWTPDWREAVRHPEVELVVIALPHDLHAPVAAAAIAAGKHVLVEKPLALTAEDAAALTAAADAAGVVLAVHHQRRFEADFVALQEVIAAGGLGEVWRITTARSHQGPYRASTPSAPHVGDEVLGWAHDRARGGGIATVVGPHPVEHLLTLAGAPVLEVSARGHLDRATGVEDWIAVDVRFEGGVTGTAEAFRRSGVAPPRFVVYGSRGTAVADDGTRVVVHADGGDRMIDGLEPPGRLGGDIYDDLVAAIRTGTPMRVPAADAVAVVDVLDRADRDLVRQGILPPRPR
jgi:scyllo-inositol 2-dehydrogenase (NADP+)